MFRSKSLQGWGIVCAVVLLAIAGLPAQETASLQVKVKYTGQGAVNEAHAIHVFVFDTPSISAASIPIGYSSITSNGEAATFSSLTASPVYIAVAYDEAGGYDPNTAGPPPSGSPAALYSTDTPGVPAGVALEKGKENKLEFEFGDAFRMP